MKENSRKKKNIPFIYNFPFEYERKLLLTMFVPMMGPYSAAAHDLIN